jgi:hypothetical protein
MSLAINAAPFDNVDQPMIQLQPSSNGQKKLRNNRTVKLRSGTNKISSENVNSIISNIHSNQDYESSEGPSELGDFTPLAPPVSAGVEQTRSREEDDEDEQSTPEYSNSYDKQPNVGTVDTSNTANYDKYRQYIPDYKKMYGDDVEVDELTGDNGSPSGVYSSVPVGGRLQNAYTPVKMAGSDPLMDKLNHVIHLLEEQQDDKTAHVTEEIVLYLFLGIFVIFIVDSFTRLGKYTR